jgi:competence protein ComEC
MHVGLIPGPTHCLARKGIYGLLQGSQVTLLRRDGGSRYCRLLLSFRSRARATVARILPDPEALPLSGILLELKTGISDEVKDAYSTTGTTHVIATSGFNRTQTTWVGGRVHGGSSI